jgi:hypothetical protein
MWNVHKLLHAEASQFASSACWDDSVEVSLPMAEDSLGMP